jgi:putative acetyltransferase
MVILETPRLMLRAFEPEDLDDFYEYARNPEVGPNAGWPPHESKDVTFVILNRFMEKEEVWAIVHKETGKVIGSLGMHSDEKRRGVNARMIGYVLSKDYWGQGLMTEAVKEALDYLFNDVRVDVVSIYHYPFNMRSKRVIEKCGFKFEGVLRRASQIYDGQVYDDYCYSILREEYIGQ